MRSKKMGLYLVLIGIAAVYLFAACGPIREFRNWPAYQGPADLPYAMPTIDTSKKTVVIVADTEGTEIFDLLAPFHLFSATQKANVLLLAEKKSPIVLRKGLFVLPHASFADFDALGISPDVLIIPRLSAMNRKQQNPEIISWIQSQYQAKTTVLSVCAGALTAAATGIFDGKPLTTHASDYAFISGEFEGPEWSDQLNVTQEGNLYSTAGISNAVDGSLLVIKDLFGVAQMNALREQIKYPHTHLKRRHARVPIRIADKLKILSKVLFKKNNRIGVLLQEGSNEFELAAVIDSYHRTFPKSIESFLVEKSRMKTMYGLTLMPTGDNTALKVDELHVLQPEALTEKERRFVEGNHVVAYPTPRNTYIIADCLQKIGTQYGSTYQTIVELMMDYDGNP